MAKYILFAIAMIWTSFLAYEVMHKIEVKYDSLHSIGEINFNYLKYKIRALSEGVDQTQMCKDYINETLKDDPLAAKRLIEEMEEDLKNIH